MTVAERLKALRINLGKTQEEVANAIGTSKQNIYKYENGTITNIPLDKIEALSDYFHVNPAYLVGWIDKNTSSFCSVSYSNDRVPDMLVKFWNALDNNKKAQLAVLICEGPDRFMTLDTKKSSSISEEDQQLLSSFHRLDEKDQYKVLGYIDSLYGAEKYSAKDTSKHA